jgi:Na+/H+ antiporter NhaD/arsenite permease-like protein
VSILLGTFYVLDRRNFLRAPAEVRDRETGPEQHWHASGLVNLPLLGLALGCVFLRAPWRELGMVAVAVASYFLTPKSVHQANDFSFGPLKEVAWLFLGIFATMVPALDYLERHAASLGLSSPMSFYFLTGTLSAVLDNAPTYLTFLTAALGLYESPDGHVLSVNSAADVRLFVAAHPLELMAISLGAVFFGAMTYIGNGPNLMVKSIAERSRVRVPSFFGYVWRYTLPYLLPPLVAAGWIFLRAP